MAEVLFNLRAAAFPTLNPFSLAQGTVNQQVFYEPHNQLMYFSQVMAGGVTLPDETGPPASGVRAARGDLTISRVNMSGDVTGAMYCRRFDHGSGIGAEYDPVDGKTYVWLSFDAVQQPIGENGHGRRLCRIPFVDQAVIDPEDVPAGQAFEAFPDVTATTPGLDLVNNRITVAHTQGSGTTYSVFDLTAFKAKNYNSPLYTFARPSYPLFQSWMAFGNYVYQQHGMAYNDTDNPEPPDGNGNAFWIIIDMRTGNVVDRVDNHWGLTLDYREPESMAVFDLPGGPQFTFAFAIGDTGARKVAMYAITGLVDTTQPIRADVVAAPEDGVQLTVSVEDTQSVQTWSIEREVTGTRQTLFSGTGAGSLPAVSTWFDSAPVGCIEMTYHLVIHRTDGTTTEAASNSVTYTPDGGCNQGGPAVGGEDNTLGCASGYTAQLHWRGGALPYESSAMDRLTEVTWNRTINDVAAASVTVLKGNVSAECCKALGEAEPWVHELTLYRDGELVWQGPVTKTTSRRDSIVIEAQDVTSWFDHMVNTWRVTYTSVAADSAGRKMGPITSIAYNHIRLNMTGSSLAEPDFAGIMDYIIVRSSMWPMKVEKDGSKNTTIWTAFLGDILREWAKRGLTWTTIGRAILLRPKPTSATRAQARLTMEDFTGEIEVIKDGTQGGVYGFATTQDQQDISQGKTLGYGKTKTAYGRLDVLVSVDEENVKDADLREAAKDAIAGRYPVPVTISVPDGSALAATAPVKLQQLVPGERFDVLAETFCQPVLQGFVLTDVEGSWQNGQEKIGVTLTPLADLDEELTT